VNRQAECSPSNSGPESGDVQPPSRGIDHSPVRRMRLTRCRFFDFKRCAAALAGLGGLHAHGVFEAVEGIEQADGAQEFHHLALGVEAAQFRPLRVRN